MRNSVQRIAAISLALFGVVGLICVCASPHFLNAKEDAVILFSYSRNLAQTGVISFYPGGPPVEGATDFLWMLLLALGARLGFNLFYCATIISALSVVTLSAVLLKIAKMPLTVLSVLAVTGLLFFSPQTWAAMTGFSVFAFAAFLALFVWLLLENRMQAASLAGLGLCLIRPDGVVFVVPVLVLFLFGSSNRLRDFRAIALLFILPGVLYFVWRWHYFKEFLPLPFLVKSDAQRIAFYFEPNSVKDSIGPLAFGLIVVAIACGPLIKKNVNLKLLFGLVVIPTIFYLHERLDQDVAQRFYFYPLIAAGILIAINWTVVEKKLAFIATASFLVWVVFLGHEWWSMASISTRYKPLPGIGISRELADVPGRGTLITTEADIVTFTPAGSPTTPGG